MPPAAEGLRMTVLDALSPRNLASAGSPAVSIADR